MLTIGCALFVLRRRLNAKKQMRWKSCAYKYFSCFTGLSAVEGGLSSQNWVDTVDNAVKTVDKRKWKHIPANYSDFSERIDGKCCSVLIELL